MNERGYSFALLQPEQHSEAFRVQQDAETKVQQHLRDEVDINTIVRRFGVTGALPERKVQGVYGDFTGIEDVGSAIDRVEEIRSRFLALAPEVRERFRNDPVELALYASSVTEEAFNAELERIARPTVGGGSGAPAGAPGVVPVPVAPAPVVVAPLAPKDGSP